jgi:predicted enzyme related to lactoylglutathione lyase
MYSKGNAMHAGLNRIVIYAKDMQKSVAFYETFFGFTAKADEGGGIIELTSANGGTSIMIHQAAKSVKLGQVGVKLVFDVEDVEVFKKKSEQLGLKFGSTHDAGTYTFANAKDPDKNSVSISSRAFRRK